MTDIISDDEVKAAANQFTQIRVGDVITFAPNPRWPNKAVEATVWCRRDDPRLPSLRSTQASRGRGQGFFDTTDSAGVKRSVRPSRATFVRRPIYVCIGGTPAPGGGVHGDCVGHGPPCVYCTADGVSSPLLGPKA